MQTRHAIASMNSCVTRFSCGRDDNVLESVPRRCCLQRGANQGRAGQGRAGQGRQSCYSMFGTAKSCSARGSESNGVSANLQNTLNCRADRRIYLTMQQSPVISQDVGQRGRSIHRDMCLSMLCVGSGTSLARAGWHAQMQQPSFESTQQQNPLNTAL